VPVLLGVVVAYTISASLQPSVYDVLLSVNRLPHIGRAHKLHYYALEAKDILHRNVPFLTPQSSFVEALACLRAQPPRGSGTQPMYEFPVLDSASSLRLLGTVSRDSLQSIFDQKDVPDVVISRVDAWLDQSGLLDHGPQQSGQYKSLSPSSSPLGSGAWKGFQSDPVGRDIELGQVSSSAPIQVSLDNDDSSWNEGSATESEDRTDDQATAAAVQPSVGH